MNEWILVLTPILVLPIVLLFRFVGCGMDAVGTAEGPEIPLPPRQPPEKAPDPVLTPIELKRPRYRDYIMGVANNPGLVSHPEVTPIEADVIGYWRLIDAPPTGGGPEIAKDEKGPLNGHNGEFKTVALGFTAEPKTETRSGSEGATGDFVPGQNSLIYTEPTALCRQFNGGYVTIPTPAAFYTDEFTLEAWVIARPLVPNVEHTLLYAGGRYAIGTAAAAEHGFRIFEDDTGHWQVRLAPDIDTDVIPNSQAVPRGDKRTHIAVTVEAIVGEVVPTGKRVVRMYVDGKDSLPITVPAYSRPDGAPLFIGVENTTDLPTGAVKLRTPVLMQIQEVVLHRKALSKEEIQNHVELNAPIF